MQKFKSGDTVAILPIGASTSNDAQSIATIAKADSTGVELIDGRHFSENDEVCMSDDGLTYIVTANPRHLAAVRRRVATKRQPGDEARF